VVGKHLFEADLLQRAFSEDSVARLIEDRAAACEACGEGPEGRMAFDYRELLPWSLLPKVDRMSMAHSIEVRAPFLDHHLVELWSRLPPSEKVAGDRYKIRIRQYCERREIFPT